ncbi:hypothetical protein FRACYDRAFT_248933 [Fragilariopsis cylindrus CCMP1102]|uniref:Uncharacterized protein n=1 Tax=Fragilariopsis cylindrus CCMP1102 TaxID=635003 RepID=A0A1E7ETG1_9STRA|nr:hypothetical protein FRACYDRAFT_248933 [Fragilariopsis cylindrus CCMP1102]|eukprot:OEU09074.1 hypothetical protein FRACYDRAFT_248933 [Fragilariopsis cylindrus CCMP1102]
MNDHHENNEHRRQEDELLQQQQLQAEHLLSPEGQKVLSINGSRSKSEFPPFINGQIYQAVNSIANEFLSKVRTAVQDLLLMINHHDNSEHRRQDELLPQQQYKQLQVEDLLSSEGQQVLSILGSRSNLELPPFINRQINQAVNSIADKFLSKVRTAVRDLLVIDIYVQEARLEERERGLTKTIVDEDWYEDERKIANAIRYFPDVLLEKRYGMYPIHELTCQQGNNADYILKNISRIPLLVELGSELGQFDEELRGGLLSTWTDDEDTDWTVLWSIIIYDRTENGTTNLVDECFSAVWKRLRQNNHLKKEDIREYNLVGRLLMNDIGIFSEARLLYFVDWDPMTLTIPCKPERGIMLPIHWAARRDFRIFKIVIQAGLRYFPEKLAFVFCKGTHRNRDDGKKRTRTPFRLACNKHGQEKVMNEVLDCIANYCAASASPSTMESSLLMTAVTDESIHLEGLYTLLRKDPTMHYATAQASTTGRWTNRR